MGYGEKSPLPRPEARPNPLPSEGPSEGAAGRHPPPTYPPHPKGIGPRREPGPAGRRGAGRQRRSPAGAGPRMSTSFRLLLVSVSFQCPAKISCEGGAAGGRVCAPRLGWGRAGLSAYGTGVCVPRAGAAGSRGVIGSCGREERPGRAGGLLRCAATPDGVDLKVAIGGVAHDLVVEEACDQEAPCDIVVWRVRVGALRRSAPKGKACVCQGKSSGRRRRGRWVSDQGSLEGLQGSRAGLHRR